MLDTVLWIMLMVSVLYTLVLLIQMLCLGVSEVYIWATRGKRKAPVGLSAWLRSRGWNEHDVIALANLHTKPPPNSQQDGQRWTKTDGV